MLFREARQLVARTLKMAGNGRKFSRNVEGWQINTCDHHGVAKQKIGAAATVITIRREARVFLKPRDGLRPSNLTYILSLSSIRLCLFNLFPLKAEIDFHIRSADVYLTMSSPESPSPLSSCSAAFFHRLLGYKNTIPLDKMIVNSKLNQEFPQKFRSQTG